MVVVMAVMVLMVVTAAVDDIRPQGDKTNLSIQNIHNITILS